MFSEAFLRGFRTYDHLSRTSPKAANQSAVEASQWLEVRNSKRLVIGIRFGETVYEVSAKKLQPNQQEMNAYPTFTVQSAVERPKRPSMHKNAHHVTEPGQRAVVCL
jgi:hypothetical protein